MENATRGKIIQNIAKMVNVRDRYKSAVKEAPKVISAKLRALVPSKESHNYYPRDEQGNQIAPGNTGNNTGEVYTPRTRYYTPKSSEGSPMKVSALNFAHQEGQFDDAVEGDNEQFYTPMSSPRRGNSVKFSPKSTTSDTSNLGDDEDFRGLNDFDENHSGESEESAPDLARSKSVVSIKKQGSTIFKPRNSAFTGVGSFGAYGL